MFRIISGIAKSLQAKPNLSLAYLDGIEKVQAALEAGADPNSRNCAGISVLAQASFDGRLNIVRELLNEGADVNLANTKSKATPLIMAVSAKHMNIINALLDAGADPYLTDISGNSALSIAKKNDPSMASHIQAKLQQINMQQYNDLIADENSMLSRGHINADLQYVISCFLLGYDTNPKTSATPTLSSLYQPQ